MKISRTATILSLLLLLSACSSTGQLPDNHENLQDVAIEKWHLCLDKNLATAENPFISSQKFVRTVLIYCQGHKEDVLATFPSYLKNSLSRVMDNQAYAAGLARLNNQRGHYGNKADELIQSLNKKADQS